ncbi:hypothetical protein G6355_11285 [Vibrio cholerae]|uniref:hypothetical protein n=1 Tax=Vibrio cholerae TaxID=666 RepID=UPI002F2C12D7
MKAYTYVSGLLIVGCTTALPNPDYNIKDVVQVAHDYLLDSRHYVVTTTHDEFKVKFKNWGTSKNNQSILVNHRDWRQIFIQNSLYYNERTIAGLYDRIERTCWAIDKSAKLLTPSFAYRGVDTSNSLSACIGKRMGEDYPYFVVSEVHDQKTGNYLNIVNSMDIPSNNGYRCKLMNEGYVFQAYPNCEK